MKPCDFIGHFAIPQIPESQRPVEMPGADDVLISCAAHRVAAAVAHNGVGTEAPVQIPHLDASVCSATDSPRGIALAAIHTADLHPEQMPVAHDTRTALRHDGLIKSAWAPQVANMTLLHSCG